MKYLLKKIKYFNMTRYIPYLNSNIRHKDKLTPRKKKKKFSYKINCSLRLQLYLISFY